MISRFRLTSKPLVVALPTLRSHQQRTVRGNRSFGSTSPGSLGPQPVGSSARFVFHSALSSPKALIGPQALGGFPSETWRRSCAAFFSTGHGSKEPGSQESESKETEPADNGDKSQAMDAQHEDVAVAQGTKESEATQDLLKEVAKRWQTAALTAPRSSPTQNRSGARREDWRRQKLRDKLRDELKAKANDYREMEHWWEGLGAGWPKWRVILTFFKVNVVFWMISFFVIAPLTLATGVMYVPSKPGEFEDIPLSDRKCDQSIVITCYMLICAALNPVVCAISTPWGLFGALMGWPNRWVIAWGALPMVNFGLLCVSVLGIELIQGGALIRFFNTGWIFPELAIAMGNVYKYYIQNNEDEEEGHWPPETERIRRRRTGEVPEPEDLLARKFRTRKTGQHPHSVEGIESSASSRKKTLVGLGLTFGKPDGKPGKVIKRIKEDSAAAPSDLKVGDRVISIDGVPLSNITSTWKIWELIQGRPGTSSTLVVERQGDQEVEEGVLQLTVVLERPTEVRDKKSKKEPSLKEKLNRRKSGELEDGEAEQRRKQESRRWTFFGTSTPAATSNSAAVEPEAAVEGSQFLQDSGRGGKEKLVGLGLTFGKADSKPGQVIKNMRESSAASDSDLKVGDRVVSIDGVPLNNIKGAWQLLQLTQGRPGSSAELVVERQKDPSLEDFSLVTVTLERPAQGSEKQARKEPSLKEKLKRHRIVGTESAEDEDGLKQEKRRREGTRWSFFGPRKQRESPAVARTSGDSEEAPTLSGTQDKEKAKTQSWGSRKQGLLEIGLTFGKSDGRPGQIIEEMTRGSPAAVSALKEGDRVLSIDGVLLDNVHDASELRELTRGEPGSNTVLLVQRERGPVSYVTLSFAGA